MAESEHVRQSARSWAALVIFLTGVALAQADQRAANTRYPNRSRGRVTNNATAKLRSPSANLALSVRFRLKPPAYILPLTNPPRLQTTDNTGCLPKPVIRSLHLRTFALHDLLNPESFSPGRVLASKCHPGAGEFSFTSRTPPRQTHADQNTTLCPDEVNPLASTRLREAALALKVRLHRPLRDYLLKYHANTARESWVPSKRVAEYVFGHGRTNDLENRQRMAWLHKVISSLESPGSKS
ncbi:hypothetical protein Bbelb_096140 [Branchiostoma belcheri]|nr:hypothetical protein Bbelb_096140 [Branchiostoma belcheri]